MASKVVVGIRLQADNVGAFVASNRTAQSSLAKTKKSAVSASQGVITLSSAATQASSVLRTVFGVGVAAGVVALGKTALTSADQFRVLEARIRVATIATGDYEAVSGRLFLISQRNGTSLRETIKLFQNLARVAPELDANNDQMIEMLDLVQKVGVTSGASFDDMKFAMRQFGQSMASGIVRAEEFNSIVENVPELAFQIAKGMNTTVGQLRLAVVEGRVLSKEVFTAINSQADEINLIFRGFPRALEQTTTALNSGFSRALSKVNEKLSYGTDEFAETIDNIAQALSSFAENEEAIDSVVETIEDLTAAGKVLVSTYLAFKAGGLIVNGFVSLRGQVRSVRQEILALNGAAVTASTSLKTATAFTPVAKRSAPGLGMFGGVAGNQYPAGFGVLRSAAQAAPINKTTAAVRGLSAASAAAISVLGGWPVVLTAAGVAAASYAASTLFAKEETEDFEKTLLELDGKIGQLRLRQLNTSLENYEEKLTEAESAAQRYLNTSGQMSRGHSKNSEEFKRMQGEITTLTSIVERYKKEISDINAANDELAKQAGLSPETEYSEEFLNKLSDVKQAQKEVGLSKRELAILSLDGLKISEEEKARLVDETNALYDKVDANKALTEAEKEKLQADKKREQEQKQFQDQAKQFSKALDDQIVSIQQSIVALTLEGQALEVHNALMQNGLLTRTKLSQADEIRKQKIIDTTTAYYNQKQAVDQLNLSLDKELENLDKFQKLRDELNPNTTLANQYQAQLDLINNNTTPGSDAQAKLQDQLFQKYSDQVTSGYDVEAFTFEEKLQSVRDEFEKRRQIILENVALTEQQRTALEEELATARNQRLKSLEDQKTQAILQTNTALFGNLADIAKTFGGEQSGIYKALFAASKAFAIAESIVKIQQGIANAASLPFPANLPAMGTVISATAGIVSTIKGTSLPSFDGGGFTGYGSRSGGEDGKGGFYAMLHPNEVVTDLTKNQGSNSSRTGSVTIINNGPPLKVVSDKTVNGDRQIIAEAVQQARQAVAADIVKGGSNVAEAMEGIYGVKRAQGARR